MASHLETELGKLRSIIIKRRSGKIRSLKLLRQCFQTCFGKQGSKRKQKIRLINSMLKSMISARVFLLQQPVAIYDLSSLQISRR
jgi:hypothetical protein